MFIRQLQWWESVQSKQDSGFWSIFELNSPLSAHLLSVLEHDHLSVCRSYIDGLNLLQAVDRVPARHHHQWWHVARVGRFNLHGQPVNQYICMHFQTNPVLQEKTHNYFQTESTLKKPMKSNHESIGKFCTKLMQKSWFCICRPIGNFKRFFLMERMM